MRNRLWRRVGMVLAATVAGAASGLLVAGPASAHVSVSSSNATQGGFAKLTFRVPNEKDKADTTKVEITLPADTPIASVSTRPVNGWTVQADKTKLAQPIKSDDGEITEAITKITWTASADAAIKPGQFQEFDISAGPLPKVDKLAFKALQTYSDGDVVRWIEEPAADGKEPAHPAPTLKLAKATDTSAQGGATAAAATVSKSDNQDSDSATGWAVALGVAGLVAGILGLIVGVLGYRKAAARQA